ncbi:ferritin-like domain-containing protein [Desulfocicer niacini]
MNTYEGIINYAIGKEIEAENFYKEVAAKTTKDFLKEMFTAFADEEKKHQKILNNVLKNKIIGSHFKASSDYGISKTVEKPDVSDGMTLADAFAIAMKNEEEAMNMYLKLAADCDSADARKIFQDLAAMEKGHKFKMETAYTETAYAEVW